MAERTPLTPSEEARFRRWSVVNGITDVDHPESRYDYRGYWRDVASKGVDQRKEYDDGLHFPDTAASIRVCSARRFSRNCRGNRRRRWAFFRRSDGSERARWVA